MPAMIMNTITAAVAAAGVALASFVGVANTNAYEEGAIQRLSQAEVALHAGQVFARSDRNGDASLDVDEFAALTIVTAELANLNGFIAMDKDASAMTIALPINAPAALSSSEHARIDAVARHTFYGFAGSDGKMQKEEYAKLQHTIFESSDINANGALTRSELSLFAQRQAYLRPSA